jgi:hypothetical protein
MKQKLNLTRQQNEFVEIFGKVINGKYIHFPMYLEKLGDNTYNELELKDLPVGIQKFIKEQNKEK